ncbi:MAG TPA: serine hydrolase domain-containing protein [Bacteroidia bacterium]|nr:serine hydrolase domain-containing protein [Bacteroidia bacterium]
MKILFLTLCLLADHTFAQQIDNKQLFSGFDKMLSEQYKSNETGATALVARNGRILYKKAFGMANLEYAIPMQVDNVFRIGSITKQFTAVVILQLMEQGKLNLQDDITRFIPDYPTHGHTITIEHLLTHTSGIRSYTDMKDFEEKMSLDLKPGELINHFKNEPMEFAPGTKWNYSNSGYFLLGYIIEKITGKTYAHYVEENIFKPLGMTNSLYGSDSKIVKYRAGAYDKDSIGFVNAPPISMTQPYSAGSIQSTVEDLFKWHQAVHSCQLVKKESLDKAFTKYTLTDGTETDYGYGWYLDNVQERPTIEHGGGINGFLTQSIYLPKEDVFVAVFSNCNCNPPDVIGAKIAALTIGKPYEYKEIPIENTVLKGYTGVYENVKGEQRLISLSENQLYSQRSGSTKYKVNAYQKDKFFFESMMTTIEFSRNDTGEIEKLQIKGRQGNEVWKKTNKPIPTEQEKE